MQEARILLVFVACHQWILSICCLEIWIQQWVYIILKMIYLKNTKVMLMSVIKLMQNTLKIKKQVDIWYLVVVKMVIFMAGILIRKGYKSNFQLFPKVMLINNISIHMAQNINLRQRRARKWRKNNDQLFFKWITTRITRF